MIPSMRAQLDLLRPHLVPRLCSEQDFSTIEGLGDTLPAVGTAGFESVLNGRSPGLDLSIAFRRAHPAGRYLAGDEAVGISARALLAETFDPASPLYEAFGVYWLEFDTSTGERRPSLFAGPRAAEPRNVVIRASEIALGRPLTPAVRTAVTRWCSAWTGIKLFQVGWMLGRADPGLRLCFCASDNEAMQSLIAEATSGVQRERLLEACRRYGDLVSELALAIDIGDGDVAPRVGLELGFRGWKPEQSLPRWGELLDRILADGLCTRSDCRALLAWPGRMTERSAADDWPVHLRGAGALLGPYQARVDRALHHIKLVVEDGDVTATKAYLVTFQTWGRG